MDENYVMDDEVVNAETAVENDLVRGCCATPATHGCQIESVIELVEVLTSRVRRVEGRLPPLSPEEAD